MIYESLWDNLGMSDIIAAIHSIISTAGDVTAVYRLLSAPISQAWRRAISVIFENLPLAISPHFSPFLAEVNLCVFRCA